MIGDIIALPPGIVQPSIALYGNRHSNLTLNKMLGCKAICKGPLNKIKKKIKFSKILA